MKTVYPFGYVKNLQYICDKITEKWQRNLTIKTSHK